ncbi:hypothetical protein ACHAQH_002639 [Verticillium albo-atrum]
MASLDLKISDIRLFSPRADLTLIVGPARVEALVESQRLISASGVFRTMLTRPFRESKPHVGRWVVSLPDDDPEIFFIIFRCMHIEEEVCIGTPCENLDCRRRLPPALDLNTLLAVVQLAEKYDLEKPLRRWEPPSISKLCFNWSGEKALPVHLTVAWHLAHERLFVQKCAMLAWDVEVDDAGEMLYDDGTVATDLHDARLLLPQRVLDEVAAFRANTINRFVAPIRTDLKRLRSHKSCEKVGPITKKERQSCGLTVLDSIHHHARFDDDIAITLKTVFAAEPASTCGSTPRRLVMRSNKLYRCDWKKYPGHESCSPFPVLKGNPMYTFPIKPLGPELLREIRAKAEAANRPIVKDAVEEKQAVLGFRVPFRRWADPRGD